MSKAIAAAFVVAMAAAAALVAQGRFGDRERGSRVAAALDADGDGVIGAVELRNAPAALRALDADGDGRVSADELRPPGRPGGPRGEGGPAPSAEDLADTLLTFDRDGDGRLARAEVPERFQGLFARADADSDGVLTGEELRRSATASIDDGAARRGGPPDPLVRALDTDRDGALSGAELGAAATALRALDADRDGQLTGDEYRPPFRGPRGRDGGRR